MLSFGLELQADGLKCQQTTFVEKVKDEVNIARTFGDALGDDNLLDYKAESLFALGKRNEGEQNYQNIIDHNPDSNRIAFSTPTCAADLATPVLSLASWLRH